MDWEIEQGGIVVVETNIQERLKGKSTSIEDFMFLRRELTVKTDRWTK